MNYTITSLDKSKISKLIEEQLLESLNQFSSCISIDFSKVLLSKSFTNDNNLHIFIIKELSKSQMDFINSVNSFCLLILTIPTKNYIKKDNIFYATFSEKVRYKMHQFNLNNIFTIPFILDESKDSFKEAINLFNKNIQNEITESIEFYLNKPYLHYKTQFNANAQYRQVLKIVNLFLNNIKIANANFNYTYKNGEMPK